MVIIMEKKTKYAIFNYVEQDQDLIDGLEEYLNEHVEEIYEFFDTELQRKQVNINIIPTKQQYDEIVIKKTNKTEIPDWEIGNASNGGITQVSLHDYGNTSHAFPPEKYDQVFDKFKKTMIHEYTHVVVHAYLAKYDAGYTLRYLNEGIAQYLSKQQENIELNMIYSLEDILESTSCYKGWFLLTKYIVEVKGQEYFLNLLRNRLQALSETPILYEEATKYYESLKNNNKVI